MAAAPLYCVCRQPYDVSRFMIECDICKDWFHGSCVHVEEHQAADIDVYHCPNCNVLHGPSVMKKRNNWHRHDYTEPDGGTKPVQAGTSVFVRQLQERTFPSADEILVKMQGSQVTQKYLEKQGFQYPIAVPKLDGLGLRLPPSSFSVMDVEHYVGGDKIVDVIDVARQADSKIKLSEFVKYYYKPHRPKVLNVISLEFSDTRMANLVEVPEVAQKMSWVENYWPDDSFFPKPFVQKYCLMSVKDSYTDFHIDFGGTSVWYHVLWGEKIFYLIKPTQENLALYEQWSSSPNQSEVFFGEKVDKCYKCVVRQGTTLLLPTGWIHAVLTSQDCMAFGGNFLHNLNIGMQLRCYEMERRLKTPDLFKFPYFEAICWYVAKNLLETLKESREDSCQPPTYLLEGVKALIAALKSWLKREVSDSTSEVPDHIRPNHLIKELTKEIRYQEEEQGGKLTKTQGNGMCLATRSTLDRGCQARRTARRTARQLRDQHATKTPSNLDILELHTREVLKRLEVVPFEEPDASLSCRINGKFNKASTASAAAVEKAVDNDLRLVLCNGRIVRDERPRTAVGGAASEGAASQSREDVKVKVEPWPLREEKPNGFFKGVKSELRNGALQESDTSHSRPENSYSVQRKDSSEEESGSSEDDDDEEEYVGAKGSPREMQRGQCQLSAKASRSDRAHKRERPTSPSTEAAIQGMLSMAGLLDPHVSEESANSQEPWWSSPGPRSPNSGGGESLSGEESSHADSDCSSGLSHQSEQLREERRAHFRQESKRFIESGDGEAWINSPSPLHRETELQYRETSPSPPLHPCKRLASNPLPISNQATKGKRPKKGMATAKQRLGKILKLNRQSRFFL